MRRVGTEARGAAAEAVAALRGRLLAAVEEVADARRGVTPAVEKALAESAAAIGRLNRQVRELSEARTSERARVEAAEADARRAGEEVSRLSAEVALLRTGADARDAAARRSAQDAIRTLTAATRSLASASAPPLSAGGAMDASVARPPAPVTPAPPPPLPQPAVAAAHSPWVSGDAGRRVDGAMSLGDLSASRLPMDALRSPAPVAAGASSGARRSRVAETMATWQ